MLKREVREGQGTPSGLLGGINGHPDFVIADSLLAQRLCRQPRRGNRQGLQRSLRLLPEGSTVQERLPPQ